MKRLVDKGKRLLLLAALLAAVFLLAGDSALPGSPVPGLEAGGFSPLFFGQTESGLYLVMEEGQGVRVYYLDQASLSDPPRSVLLERPPDSIGVDGDSLCLFTDSSGFQCQISLGPDLDLYAAQESAGFYFAPFEPGRLFAAPAGGPLYLTGEDGRLRTYLPNEPEPAGDLLEQPEFLGASSDGQVFAYSQGVLHCWLGDGHQEYESLLPTRLLGGGAFLDSSGTVCRLEDGAVRPVLQAEDAAFLCFDGEYLLTAGSSGAVRRYDQDGQAAGSYSLGGEILGLTPGYVLANAEGGLWVYPHDFQREPEESPPTPEPPPVIDPDPEETPEPLPSPSVTPEPQQTPAPSATPAPFGEQVEVRGKWLYIPAGSSVQQLRDLFLPESVTVYDVNDQEIFQGRLTTGMTVKDYTVVIPGDCNCSGAVDGNDVFSAQRFMLRADGFWSTARKRAADMNDDGVIDVSDLVFISLRADGFF